MKTIAAQPTTTKKSIIVNAQPQEVWKRVSEPSSLIKWMNYRQQFHLDSMVLNWKSGGAIDVQMRPLTVNDATAEYGLSGKVRTIVANKSLVFSLKGGIILSFHFKALPDNRTRIQQTLRCNEGPLTTFETHYFDYLLKALRTPRTI